MSSQGLSKNTLHTKLNRHLKKQGYNNSKDDPFPVHIPLRFCIQLYEKHFRGDIYEPVIRKIVTRSALFFGILTVSAAGMQLAAWRNVQNAPDAVAVSAVQSPVIVLDAGHGEST